MPAAIPDLTFEDLGVIPEIVEALATIGIEHPFPIQSLSIPIAIGGTDMIGQARTGTGKTLAFGISLLQRILVPTDEGYAEMPFQGLPQALVMAPPANWRCRSPVTSTSPPPSARPASSPSTAASATRPSSRPSAMASTWSSAPRVACSTSPTAAPSTCPR